jgi:hypothetical protein
MADGLRSLRWRAAVSFIGLLLVFIWVVGTGRTAHTVQIDYSWAREVLDSAEVEIDGEVVGILQRYGRSQFVTGFRVDPGEHTVSVLLDGCDSVLDTARLGGSSGRVAMFMADMDDGVRCRVVLR